MKKMILVLVLLLAGAALGLPWFLGGEARAIYQDAIADAPAHGLRVLDNRYERGWFSSHVLTELVVEPVQGQTGPTGDIQLRIASRFAHGPWSLASPRLTPAASVVETRAEIRIPGFELPPLFLTTVIELDGSGVTRLRLPAVDRTGTRGLTRVQLDEAHGEVRFEPGFSTSDAWFDLPALTVDSEQGAQLRLRGLRGKHAGSRWLGGLFVGEGGLTLEALAVRGPAGEIEVEGLSLDLKSSVPDGKLLDMHLEYRFDALRGMGADYTDARLALSLERLPGEEILALQQAMGEVTADAAAGSMAGLAVAAVLASHLPELLAQDPRLGLDSLEVTTPEGRIEANLWLGVKGLTREAMERPGAWLGHLVGAGELGMPRTSLLRLMEQWQRSQALDVLRQRDPEAQQIPPEFESQIQAAAREQVTDLVHAGWVSERSGRVLTSLELADSLITVNGKTLPLSGFGFP